MEKSEQQQMLVFDNCDMDEKRCCPIIGECSLYSTFNMRKALVGPSSNIEKTMLHRCQNCQTLVEKSEHPRRRARCEGRGDV